MNTLKSISLEPRDYDRIARAIHFLVDNQETQPELAEVAAAAGISPHHFQRLFTRWAGISPKKFLQFLTHHDAKTRLANSASVLDAALDTGLSGQGRLHDLFVSLSAATPGDFKARGSGLTFHYGFHASPFGECMVTTTERGVAGVSFCGDKNREALLQEQQAGWEHATWIHEATLTAAVMPRIFPSNTTPSSITDPLPVFLRGTKFQLKVWEALLKIPTGALVSYGQLASHLGQPNSARAVGTACGSNLIGYLIPCHRVIRDTGIITGYRWGPERKRAILAWEAARSAA